MNKKGYRNLIAWQKADKLAVNIYKISMKFPSKYFSLISQMQRAALSVPANIVEGYSRKTKQDKARFYNQAYSSLTELEYYIDFVFQLKLYNESIHQILINQQTETAKLLTGLYRATLS